MVQLYIFIAAYQKHVFQMSAEILQCKYPEFFAENFAILSGFGSPQYKNEVAQS